MDRTKATRRLSVTFEQDQANQSSDFSNNEDSLDGIVLRIAQSADRSPHLAQRLRYIVFMRIPGQSLPKVMAEKRDFDEYDQYADHLIIIDRSPPPEDGQIDRFAIILFRQENFPEGKEFYSNHEFDISPVVGRAKTS